MLMAVPSGMLRIIGTELPLLAPVAFLVMVGYLFTVYRTHWGDAAFMAIAGSFLAWVAGI